MIDTQARPRPSRRRRIIRRIAAVLAVLLTLYTILVYFLVSAALVPSFMRKLRSFERITNKSYAEQVQETKLQRNYRAQQTIAAGWADMTPHERVTIRSQDGYELVGMLYCQETSHLWVITLHGYTGWKEAMYPIACWYYQNGFNVLAPDLRCQGESEGDFIGMGWTDRLDVLQWIDLILQRDPDAQIVLHGQSMGAACALIMSGMPELPRNVRAVVADSAYTDAISMFRIKITDWFHLPSFPLVESAALMLRLRGGYDLRDAAPLRAVRRSQIPILYIHGEEDRMIPIEMTYALRSATASPSMILVVSGAGHTQAMDADPVGYYLTVQLFLHRSGVGRER